MIPRWHCDDDQHLRRLRGCRGVQQTRACMDRAEPCALLAGPATAVAGPVIMHTLASSHFPESRCCRSRFTTAGRTSGRGILSAILLRAMSPALGAFAPLRGSGLPLVLGRYLATNTG